MAIPPNEIISILSEAEKVLVVTHIFPDGDALGSQLALGDSLDAMGKEVFLYSEEKVSHLYDFLPGCGKLQSSLPDPAKYDCVVAVDCADQKRLGTEAEKLLTAKKVIMIDHHAGHKPFGDNQWIDPERASTGEMVYDLIAELTADDAREGQDFEGDLHRGRGARSQWQQPDTRQSEFSPSRSTAAGRHQPAGRGAILSGSY